MKRRYTIAALALAFAAATGLTACSSSPAEGGDVKLRVLISNNPASVEFFKKDMIPAFEKAYPNITVTFDSAETNGYHGTIKTRLAANAVDTVLIDPGSGIPPEYASTATPSDDQLLEKAGAFVDQSSQSYVSRWLPSVVDSSKVDGKIYGLPTGSNIVNGIYYNKDMFTKLGLEAPTTWSEFQTVMSTLKQNSVTPLAIGGKDVWPAGLVMLGMVQSLYPDLPALDKGLWTHSVKLSDPTSVKLLEQLKEVFDNTQPEFAGVAYSNVYSEFTNQKVAMIPDGSWANASIAAAKPGFEYGYFALPGSETASDNVFGLKPEGAFAVSSKSSKAQQDAAFKWIDFFSEPDTYAKFIGATGFVPVLKSISTDDSPFLTAISDKLADAKTEWEYVYHFNANGSPSSKFPWDYSKIAPLGSETDMNALGKELQELLVQGQTS